MWSFLQANRGSVDILLVSETNIDDSFLQGHLVIDGFSASYKLDCNSLGDGLMLFVREDILSNLLTTEEKPAAGFYAELNLCNSKWLVSCFYIPHKNSIGNHLDRISESLDLLSFDYEKLTFLGDFNVTDDEHHMDNLYATKIQVIQHF